MALKEVTRSNFVKSNATPVGERIKGYVLGIAPGGPLSPDKKNIYLLLEDKSQVVNLTCHGTLNYFWDNKNEPGFYYEFLRLADKKNKMGKVVAQFQIFKDEELKVNVEEYLPKQEMT